MVSGSLVLVPFVGLGLSESTEVVSDSLRLTCEPFFSLLFCPKPINTNLFIELLVNRTYKSSESPGFLTSPNVLLPLLVCKDVFGVNGSKTNKRISVIQASLQYSRNSDLSSLHETPVSVCSVCSLTLLQIMVI